MTIDRARLRWNGWGWQDHPAARDDRAQLWRWVADTLGLTSLTTTPSCARNNVTIPASRLTPAAYAALAALLGDDGVSIADGDRLFHARARSYLDLLALRGGALPSAPDAVLFPRSTEDVLALLQIAEQERVAVVPFGGGSSVVGGVTPLVGMFAAVVTVNLTRMTRVLKVDMTSLTATAEAGIYGPVLETELQRHGVTLGHTPQSFEFSTLGGWIAARGAGQMSGRYGKAERWLQSARLATPRGLWSSENFPASAAGPRLTDLIAGSEGALGIITDATVRVRRIPAVSRFACFLFPDFSSGLAAVRAMVQGDVPSAMLRLSDPDEVAFYRGFSHAGREPGRQHTFKKIFADAYLRLKNVPARPALLVASLEGSAALVRYASQQVKCFAVMHGGVNVGASPGRSWVKTRFEAPYRRDAMLDHGLGVDTVETATSWANVDRVHRAVTAALRLAIAGSLGAGAGHGVVMCHVSHVYPDGASLYFTFVFPRRVDDADAQWSAIKTAASDAIVAHGGTISHHHGVGTDHTPWLEAEKGPIGMRLLRAIKGELDPAGILNPGKIFV